MMAWREGLRMSFEEAEEAEGVEEGGEGAGEGLPGGRYDGANTMVLLDSTALLAFLAAAFFLCNKAEQVTHAHYTLAMTLLTLLKCGRDWVEPVNLPAILVLSIHSSYLVFQPL